MRFRTLYGVLTALLTASSAHAELDKAVLKLGEAKLKSEFEGSQVTVKVDMPATAQGVDIHVGATQPFDLGGYSKRVKEFGIALKNGANVMVTKVKVNPKFIEFQLAGGGYGTFGDDTSPDVGVPSAEKTRREKDLENWIRGEPDAEKKRGLQRELDDLRKARAREDASNRAAAASATETQRALIAEKRLSGGSRFNIRYANGVPQDALEPAAVRAALAKWVDFGAGMASATPAAASSTGGTSGLRKGMLIDEVERALGRPEKLESAMVDGLKKTMCEYHTQDGHVEAVFVEGVLVRYSMRSH